nr:non-specific lipid-transfer protein 2 [Ipomoea trifida]
MIVAVLMLLLAEAQFSSAACDVQQLTPCLSALTSNTNPSQLCCQRLNQQKPCFCQYLKNPSLKMYLNSPAAKKAAKTCKSDRLVLTRCGKLLGKGYLRGGNNNNGSPSAYISVSVNIRHEAQFSSAACDVQQLTPCLSALTSNTNPSQLCCQRLNQQKPCFCQYLKNPSLKMYLNSPAAKKAAKTCKVSIPKC